jgi:hypothetical protein
MAPNHFPKTIRSSCPYWSPNTISQLPINYSPYTIGDVLSYGIPSSISSSLFSKNLENHMTKPRCFKTHGLFNFHMSEIDHRGRWLRFSNMM